MSGSLYEKCKTPRGQLIIFSVVIMEMTLGVYLAVFGGGLPDVYQYNNATGYGYHTIPNTINNVVLMVMIDIPVFGVIGAFLRYVVKVKVDVTFRLLKLFTLMAIVGFIGFVISIEVNTASHVNMNKPFLAFGIITGLSALGAVALLLKSVWDSESE